MVRYLMLINLDFQVRSKKLVLSVCKAEVISTARQQTVYLACWGLKKNISATLVDLEPELTDCNGAKREQV